MNPMMLFSLLGGMGGGYGGGMFGNMMGGGYGRPSPWGGMGSYGGGGFPFMGYGGMNPGMLMGSQGDMGRDRATTRYGGPPQQGTTPDGRTWASAPMTGMQNGLAQPAVMPSSQPTPWQTQGPASLGGMYNARQYNPF